MLNITLGRIDDKYIWTHHAREKMRYYGLSEGRIKRIIRHPARVEEGILEGAVACMQMAEGKRYSEIWVMYLIVPQGGPRGSAFSRHDSFASSGELAKSRTKFPAHNFSEKLWAGPSKLRPPLSRKRTTTIALDSTYGLRKLKIITAWRYPGRSPKREPIPSEILREIRKLL